MTGAHCMHSVEQSMILWMFHNYCTMMICLSLCGTSVLMRAVFRGSFPYGDVERGSTHLPSRLCVWSLSLCRCVGARACGASPGQIVYMYTIGLSMPGKREALSRCWFNVRPRRIDGRPALIRHWFSVLCVRWVACIILHYF